MIINAKKEDKRKSINLKEFTVSLLCDKKECMTGRWQTKAKNRNFSNLKFKMVIIIYKAQRSNF